MVTGPSCGLFGATEALIRRGFLSGDGGRDGDGGIRDQMSSVWFLCKPTYTQDVPNGGA